MNILLTGGAGYIGSHTTLALLDKGHSVTIIDNLITGSSKLIPKTAKFINADISNKDEIKKLLKKNKFDLVMHFAGLIKVEESIEYPDKYETYNVQKPKVFLECCIEAGLKKIIFSSTAGVYGKLNENKKVNENDKLEPANPYAKSKLLFEKHLLELVKTKKIECTILRYFNVAGADHKERSGLLIKKSNNLIKVVCEVAAGKRKKIIINGNSYKTKDGTPVRDFIHVSDLADMHIVAGEYLLSNKNSDIYNCGYGVGYSVSEIIREMENILKEDLAHEIGPERDGDIPFSVANNEKFKKKFNWNPKYNKLNYILNSALNWEKKNK